MKVLKKQSEKRKSRRKAHGGTFVSVDHKPGSSSNDGHEDRMRMFMKTAIELKARGLTYQEIAPRIAKQYKLATVPHLTTVAVWCWKAQDTIDEEIRDIARQLRWDQWAELERMKSALMPIVCEEELEIRRWVVENGVRQPIMDQDVVTERLKACSEVVRIHARQARLMGLDLDQVMDENGNKPMSMQDLQIWLVRKMAEKPAIETEGRPVLELRSGLEEELAEIMKEKTDDGNGV